MKLKSLFQWKTDTDGIFYHLNQIAALPWKAKSIYHQLDIEYFGNRSGNKTVSCLVDELLTDGELTSTDKTLLANTIWAMFGDKWKADYNVLNAQYDPIENYSMTETRQGSDSHTQTPDNWKTTETQTPTDWTETTSSDSADNEQTVENEVYGFNSVTGEPSQKQTTTVKSNVQRAQSGTFETETEQTGSYTTAGQSLETTTRTGNIGVTTSQQMIRSEIDLREWLFYRSVMGDIDSILTLGIYE